MTPNAGDAPTISPTPARTGRRSTALLALVCAALTVGVAASLLCAHLWRSTVRTQQRQAFASSAANVTATLGTLLRRDDDFVATLRGVLTMEPHLTATGFDTWYTTLNGSERQVGGIGRAVVEDVPASQLSAFLARRNADPAFRSLLGRWLLPVPRAGTSNYCLLAA